MLQNHGSLITNIFSAYNITVKNKFPLFGL